LIDLLTLALTHGLILLALVRLLPRPELDSEAPAPRPRPWTKAGRKPAEQATGDA
jgi:hypothetical protein